MNELWGPDGGLAAMDDAGEDVWQLAVRSRGGGGANKLVLGAITGTAKKQEVSGKATGPRASLSLPPLSSPSLPLSAKYAPASSNVGGVLSLGSERPRLDMFCAMQFQWATSAALNRVAAGADVGAEAGRGGLARG